MRRAGFSLVCTLAAISVAGGQVSEGRLVSQHGSGPPPEVRSQTAPFLPTQSAFHSQANLVEVTATVLDGNDRPVAGLTASDFTIRDEDRPQKIESFSEEHVAAAAVAAAGSARPVAGGAPAPAAIPGLRGTTESASPRSIALFFDDLHAEAPDMTIVRRAVSQYIQGNLGAGDRMAIFTASGVLSQNYTADARTLLAKAQKLGSHLRMDNNGISACPRITPEQAYKAAVLADQNALDTAIAQAVQCNCIDQGDIVMKGKASPSGQALSGCYAMQTQVVRALADATWAQAQNETQATLNALAGAVQSVAAQPGKRIVVLASPGFVTGDAFSTQEDEIGRYAVRHDTVIDAIDVKGLVGGDVPWRDLVAGYVTDPDPLVLRQDLALALGPEEAARMTVYDLTRTQELVDLTDGMAAVADDTGGRLFWNNNDLAGGLHDLTAPPAVYYALTFAPDRAPDGAFHKLDVSVNAGKNLRVEARKGYFADGGASGGVEDEALTRAALGDELQNDLGMRLATKPSTTPATAGVAVMVAIDVRDLAFTRVDGRNADKIAFASVLFDSRGKAVAGKKADMTLNLTDAQLRALETSGFTAVLSLEAPSGNFRLREVVLELATGRSAVADTAVRLP